jgi:hypothetical protein
VSEPGPYQPPESDLGIDAAARDANPAEKSPAEKTLFAIGLLGALLTALIATFVVPRFDEVFKNFGAELPLPTLIVSKFYGLAWLLPLLPTTIWFGWLGWPEPHKRGRIAALMAMAIPVIGFPFLIFALYLPVFSLPATI